MGALIVAMSAGTGCSTAKVRVMPGENGVNQVLVRDIERDDAEVAAVDAANDYCKKQNRTAIFTKNKTSYTGDMDESTRNTIRKASGVATVLGATGVIPDDSRAAGAILGSAGVAGRSMTNDRDYQSQIEFKCQ